MVRMVFTQEFVNFVKQHGDLYVGYWVSAIGGSSGIAMIFTNPFFDVISLILGLILSVSSIVLTIYLTFKAKEGIAKIREEKENVKLRNEQLRIENKQLRKDLENGN